MNMGPAIDVAIGLIFVFLLLGLITTAVQEIVATYFQWRGKLLVGSITDLLADGDSGSKFFRDVFGHGLIKGLGIGRAASYLPSPTFCLALIEALSAGRDGTKFSQIENGVAALPAGTARESLLALLDDAAGDLDKLKASVAAWYDNAMDRLSGAYKRRSQIFSILFGLGVAIFLNVDALRIADRLWTDDALRSDVAAAALAYSQAHTCAVPPCNSDSGTSIGPNASADMNAARQNIDQGTHELAALKLPIGWMAFVDDINTAESKPSDVPAKKPATAPSNIQEFFQLCATYYDHFGIFGLLLILGGWVVTGIAASLGAPFWFDLLKNVLSLRGAGPKPPRADQAGSTT